MSTPKLSALVLAGPRPGGDPLAAAHGVVHKAALPLAGRPMGEWVVEALRAAPAIGKVFMAADWRSLTELVPLMTPERVVPVAAYPSIGETVEAVLDAVPPPLLITTVDHPLLSPQIIAEFLDNVPLDADGAVAVARQEVVSAAYPSLRRAYVGFRRARVTGCNLFLLNSGRARGAVQTWTRMDMNSGEPAAMVAALGLGARLMWSFGLLSLDGAARRLSHRVGARLAVVEMTNPQAALDVDNAQDLRLAESILGLKGYPRTFD